MIEMICEVDKPQKISSEMKYFTVIMSPHFIGEIIYAYNNYFIIFINSSLLFLLLPMASIIDASLQKASPLAIQLNTKKQYTFTIVAYI